MILTASLRVWKKFKFLCTCSRAEAFSNPPNPNLQNKLIVSLLKSCSQSSETTQIHACMIKVGLDLITFPLSKLLASSIPDIAYARSIFDRFPSPNLFIFNTILRAYSISKSPREAFSFFNSLRATGISLDQFSFISTLKSCARELALSTGQCIHGAIIVSGFDFFINLRNTLLHFYCVCGRIADAHQVFDEIPHLRDVVSWNALMSGYLQVSQPAMVVELFGQMRVGNFEASDISLMSLLSASGDMEDIRGGASLHGLCVKKGLCSYLNVATAIVAMYVNGGSVESARHMFDEMPNRDVVSWNCIIDGYAKNGIVEESLALLQAMKGECMKPNSATVAGLLSACASAGALGIGRCVHEFIEEEHLELDAVLGTGLVDMYSKCGLIYKAVDVFNQIPRKDVMSWTAMISGFGVNGQGEDALKLFHQMVEQGVIPNEITFLAVLSACSHAGLVIEGKQLFESLVHDCSFSPKIEHYGCMVDLLGRAGLLEEAHELIKSLPIKRDVTAWRALLAACRVYGDVKLGEIAERSLMELDDKNPAVSVLLLSTYAAAERWDVVTSTNLVEEMMRGKEAGWSSIELDS
ncbi:hypothetical protein AAC387_Pa09g2330 [Persea americana]